MDLNEVVGRNIRKQRLLAGMSQSDLCRSFESKSGATMNVRHLSNIERLGQNLTLSTINRIAKGLGIEPAMLLETKNVFDTVSRKEAVGIKKAINILQSVIEP